MSQTNINSNFFSAGRVLPMLKILILALILSVGVSYVLAAAPASNPPTCDLAIDACNPPLHTGARAQIKTGGISVGSLISTGDALLNNSLGIAIGAGLPTANLDVAGTLRFRGNVGDATSAPAAGKVLTAMDATGVAKWQTSSSNYQIKTGWYPLAYNTACGGVCHIAVSFNSPFAAGVRPVVTAQPMWVTATGDESPSWGVSDITNTGFTLQFHSPSGARFGGGESGLMWTAVYDPSNAFDPSTMYHLSCYAVADPKTTTGVNAGKAGTNWYIVAPNIAGSPGTAANSIRVFNGDQPDPPPLLANTIYDTNYLPTKVPGSVSTQYLAPGTYTRKFAVSDLYHTTPAEYGRTSCSVTIQ